MRGYPPPSVLSLVVTKPLFERLCALDEGSFLYKPFWRDLLKALEQGGARHTTC